MKKFISMLFMAIMPFLMVAQSTDPAVQKAKEETVVIFDLGRFFGYLHTLEEESDGLEMSKSQLEEVYTILSDLLILERIEIDYAEETLIYMEDELLTIDQLIFIDEQAILREENRTGEKGSGTGSGGGNSSSSGGNTVASFVSGGAFNPLTDASKSMGSDVKEFYAYLKKKLKK